MNKLFLAPTTLPDIAAVEYIEAAAAGFDGMGLRLNRSPGLPFYPVVGDAAVTREVRRALAQTGLPVLDILSFYLQPETDIRAFEGALELDAEIGARYLMVIGDDPHWPRLRDNFAGLCEMASGFRLACSLEFATQRRIGGLPEALRLIAEAGRSDTVLCLDFLHFARSGGKPEELRALDPKLLPMSRSPMDRLRPRPLRAAPQLPATWASPIAACPAGARSQSPPFSTPCLRDCPSASRLHLRRTRRFLESYGRRGA